MGTCAQQINFTRSSKKYSKGIDQDRMCSTAKCVFKNRRKKMKIVFFKLRLGFKTTDPYSDNVVCVGSMCFMYFFLIHESCMQLYCAYFMNDGLNMYTECMYRNICEINTKYNFFIYFVRPFALVDNTHRNTENIGSNPGTGRYIVAQMTT